MRKKHEMTIEFDSCSENESFARMVTAAFITRLDPTVGEMSDVKTAVSEAVTNAIIHGYEKKEGTIVIHGIIRDNELWLEIQDKGVGITDIDKAMEPCYTTKPELDRSGMGFAFMEAFMDKLEVSSEPGKGTTVHMYKKFDSAQKE